MFKTSGICVYWICSMSTSLAATCRRQFMPAQKFLVDFRVVISSVLFSAMVVVDLTCGLTHGWGAEGDWIGRTGAAVVLAGLAIRTWAAGVLNKGLALAVGGPFSLCRHPLYVGSFLMMVGFFCLLGDVVFSTLLVGLMTIVYRATIANEESRLSERYPAAWAAYVQATPRFVPVGARYLAAPWRLDTWMRNREYRALFASLGGLVALEMLRRI
jgi:protein-S-isoprenylcysteine O-methyltransferase Ste14